MSALDFMKGQAISDEGGWVDVDKETLQHKKYRKLLGTHRLLAVISDSKE